ncbi:MAG: hypothetical protein GQE15_04145 [Archangiaceae bacterium]|nr:hypothetical protein [Archangiaceae bacterium]
MRNFTDEARALAERIEETGLLEFATAIREAIDFASTGNELLFGLRFHLRRFAAQEAAPSDLKGGATELADAIDAVLKA